jgi:hypothetical protein
MVESFKFDRNNVMTQRLEDDQTLQEDKEELRRDWEYRVATGRPILIYDFDLPMTFRVGSGGQIEMDCPCMVVGNFNRPGNIRVRLSPAAAHRLRDTFRKLEDLLGDVIPEPPRRSTH